MTRTPALMILLAAILLPALATPQGSLMLVGGGEEGFDSWSDEPYAWFVAAADSGTIINIDVHFTSGWYEGYFQSLGAHYSSHALQISSSDANDQDVYDELVGADGIFIEGGDAIDYIEAWRGTLVEDALHAVFADSGAIGGTGGGMAVLSEVVFSNESGELDPADAAYDPYHPEIAFTDDFLELLPGTFADMNFQEQGNLYRLAPMLARRVADFGDDNLLAIGIDGESALCIDTAGVGHVFGRSVNFLYPTGASEVIVNEGEPAHFTHVGFDLCLAGARYELADRYLVDPGPHMERIEWTIQPEASYTPLTLNGGSETVAYAGEVRVVSYTGDPDDWLTGGLALADGSGDVPRTCLAPRTFTDPQFYANRISGAEFAAAANSGFAVIWLDDGGGIEIDGDGLATINTFAAALRTEHATALGLSPNSLPGIAGGRLFLLAGGDEFHLDELLAGVGDNGGADRDRLAGPSDPPRTANLLPAYPNPFNASVRFSFTLPRRERVAVTVYDITGRRVASLLRGVLPAGERDASWSPSRTTASGVYLLQLAAQSRTITRRVTLLK